MSPIGSVSPSSIGSPSPYGSTIGKPSPYSSTIGSPSPYRSTIGSPSPYSSTTIGSPSPYRSTIGSPSPYRSTIGSASPYSGSIGSLSPYANSGSYYDSLYNGSGTSSYGPKVAAFDSQKAVFDQQTYEIRIDAEADIMVTLEAVKQMVGELQVDLAWLQDKIAHTLHVTELNSAKIAANNVSISGNVNWVDDEYSRTHALMDECRHSDVALYENRNALALYCQQFAFAPEMVGPCRELLSCTDRQLHFKYAFGSVPVPHHDIYDD